jgi:hypothetical protein
LPTLSAALVAFIDGILPQVRKDKSDTDGGDDAYEYL